MKQSRCGFPKPYNRYKFLGISLFIKFDLHFTTNKMDYLTPLYSKVEFFIQEARVHFDPPVKRGLGVEKFQPLVISLLRS